MLRAFFSLAALCFLAAPVRADDDLKSGPDKDKKVPALKVHDLTGENKGKEIDYAANRKDKVTVYLLLPADKFGRPMNTFMKTLDGKINDDFDGVYVVAVWLTDDLDKTKKYLPIVQKSVDYGATALTAYKGTDGPKDWNINSDAHMTVVIAAKGKVSATMAFKSLNATDVRGVLAALKKVTKAKKKD